jgi:F-type H+-transporting ATPase subunit alpha
MKKKTVSKAKNDNTRSLTRIKEIGKRDMDKTANERKLREEVGIVIETEDYLTYLEGLPSARVNDLVKSKEGARGLVYGLDREKIEVLMLDPNQPKPGELFCLEPNGLKLRIDEELLGRVISPLGDPMDGRHKISGSGTQIFLDVKALGLEYREIITQQVETGISLVDTLLPIGRGQRELIYGEPRSGKSSFIVDTIINQKDRNIVCIYAAIGKSEIDIKRLVQDVEKAGGREYTVVIAATSNVPAPIIFITPSVAMAIADWFREQGRHVLIFLDDLGTHAKYLREMSLLNRRTPGRESYPGDVFYQHAHILERAGNFNEKGGGGSVTLLPVIETDLDNFTALIPTNLMASTDGHLLFSANLRAEGRNPAIDADRSVTRVGRQTQLLLHKLLADKIRRLLIDFEELRRFSRFGAEVSEETQLAIKKGYIMQELLRQEPLQKIDRLVQMQYLGLIFTSFFDAKDLAFLLANKKIILSTIEQDTGFRQLREEMERNIEHMELDAFINQLSGQVQTLEKACQNLQS